MKEKNKQSLKATFKGFIDMKFPTLMFITLVIVVMSYPSSIIGKATTVRGFRKVAQSCVLKELIPCQPAIITGGLPSGECCDKLNEQKPCLCGYLVTKKPYLTPIYDISPNTLKVFEACKVSIPTC